MHTHDQSLSTNLKDYKTLASIANELQHTGIKKRTLEDMVRRRELKHVRFGRRILVLREWVVEAMTLVEVVDGHS